MDFIVAAVVNFALMMAAVYGFGRYLTKIRLLLPTGLNLKLTFLVIVLGWFFLGSYWLGGSVAVAGTIVAAMLTAITVKKLAS